MPSDVDVKTALEREADAVMEALGTLCLKSIILGTLHMQLVQDDGDASMVAVTTVSPYIHVLVGLAGGMGMPYEQLERMLRTNYTSWEESTTKDKAEAAVNTRQEQGDLPS